MAQIVRHEFVGNKILFTLLCLIGIGIPLAVIYFAESTVTVKEEIDDATGFLESFRS
jgi:hypothetical protein